MKPSPMQKTPGSNGGDYFFRYMAENEVELGLLTDREGKVLFLSEALSGLCEHSPSLLPPLIFESIRVGRLQAQLHKALELAREFDHTIRIEGASLKSKSPGYYHISIRPFPIDPGRGEPQYLITLEKKTGNPEQQTVESGQFYTQLLRHTPWSILLVDPIENIPLKLGGLVHRNGICPKDKPKLEDIIHPGDYLRVSEAYRDFISNIRTGEHLQLEFRLKVEPPTEETWVEAVLSEGHSLNGKAHAILNIHDISAQKRSDQAMGEENRRLEISNHDLENFAFLASHDLQEPLRTMRGMVQLLDQYHQQDFDTEGSRILDYLKEASSRMIVMIESLLEHSRIGGSLQLEEVDCQRLVEQVIADLGDSIGSERAELEVGNLPKIMGYPEELAMLFQNLISNGMKFHRPDTLPRVRIDARSHEDGWVFTIEDNGLGIPEEYQDRMFRMFQRFHAELPIKGTGIGLAHVKKVVDLHQGRIEFQSETRRGTRFEIFIPRLDQSTG